MALHFMSELVTVQVHDIRSMFPYLFVQRIGRKSSAIRFQNPRMCARIRYLSMHTADHPHPWYTPPSSARPCSQVRGRETARIIAAITYGTILFINHAICLGLCGVIRLVLVLLVLVLLVLVLLVSYPRPLQLAALTCSHGCSLQHPIPLNPDIMENVFS